MEQYPQSADKDYVLDALGSLYMTEGNPEGYFNYLRENKIAEVDESTVENTFYDTAIRDFAAMKFEEAEASFSKYLNQYPTGVHAIKSHYYRESRMTLDNKLKLLWILKLFLKMIGVSSLRRQPIKHLKLLSKHQYEEAYELYQT